jgi:hypothetical protein
MVGGQLYLAWTGTNQVGSGDQIFFTTIAAP